MEALSSIGVLFGSSWATGMNLYMTVAGLGIAQRMHWLSLPGEMKALSNPFIILVALFMYVVEFVADKIPLVDSAWDSVHTFIRPAAGAMLGYMAAANMGPVAQIPIALVAGTISMDSHLTKATGRAAINSTMIPGTNAVVSVAEDTSVFGVLYLIIKHPVMAGLVVVAFIIFSIWFLAMMFKFLKSVFRFIFGRKKDEARS